MNNLFYIAIGFVLGVIVVLYIGYCEMVGEITGFGIKKLIEILFGD